MTDKSSQTKLILATAVVVLCVALGWKALRYTQPDERMTATFDQRLTEFLDAQGWKRQPVSPDIQNKAVQIITFNKSQCPQPLRVSIVGTTSGLESYLRQKFGDDLAFVQHGSVLKHPSLLRYQLVRTWTNLLARLSGKAPDTQPIVAVTPAPRTELETCHGPTINQWSSF